MGIDKLLKKKKTLTFYLLRYTCIYIYIYIYIYLYKIFSFVLAATHSWTTYFFCFVWLNVRLLQVWFPLALNLGSWIFNGYTCPMFAGKAWVVHGIILVPTRIIGITPWISTYLYIKGKDVLFCYYIRFGMM